MTKEDYTDVANKPGGQEPEFLIVTKNTAVDATSDPRRQQSDLEDNKLTDFHFKKENRLALLMTQENGMTHEESSLAMLNGPKNNLTLVNDQERPFRFANNSKWQQCNVASGQKEKFDVSTDSLTTAV